MGALTWDKTGEHLYETGVSKCVLYVCETSGSGSSKTTTYGNGVAWNGISAITESPSGAEANAIYADNIKYLNLYSTEEFGGTIEAYMYPDEFMKCDGTATPVDGLVFGQQTRSSFGLCYRTEVGNDTEGDTYGYKLHFIYGAKASPSERNFQTVNDSPEAISFSWEFETIPIDAGEIDGKSYNKLSTITVDSTKLDSTMSANLSKLEEYIYGKDDSAAEAADGQEPKMPTPAQIYSLLKTGAVA